MDNLNFHVRTKRFIILSNHLLSDSYCYTIHCYFQTQAAIIHCGEATDKLIIMMLLSTVLFATGIVGKVFNWAYTTYCKSDKEKVGKPSFISFLHKYIYYNGYRVI